jgi:hypothetical protein
LGSEQETFFLQMFKDSVVGFVVAQPCAHLARFVRHNAPLVHRDGHREVVFQRGGIVLGAMAGGGVYTACAAGVGDMGSVYDQAVPVQEGVAGGHMLQLAALIGVQYAVIIPARSLGDLRYKVGGEDIAFCADFNQ